MTRKLLTQVVAITGLVTLASAGRPGHAQIDEGALQEVRDSVRAAFDPSRAGALYAASINFTVHPDISTADFRLDGLEDDGALDLGLSNYRLPLRHTFDAGDSRLRPFVQGTIGYQDLSLTVPLVADSDERVRADWRSKGVDVGAGFEYALDEHWTILPSLNAGVAELRNKADYGDSVLGPILQPVFEGIVFDWDSRAWIVGAGIAMRFDRALRGFDFHANSSLSSSYIRSFDVSSSDIRIDNTATTFDLELSTIHPLGTLRDRPVSLVTIVGATNLVGDARGELGFDYFLEAGLALQLELPGNRLSLDRLRVGLKAIGGPDVSGWSIIIGRGL
jgi:hypothetical protein